jgi:hypothetical protein
MGFLFVQGLLLHKRGNNEPYSCRFLLRGPFNHRGFPVKLGLSIFNRNVPSNVSASGSLPGIARPLDALKQVAHRIASAFKQACRAMKVQGAEVSAPRAASLMCPASPSAAIEPNENGRTCQSFPLGGPVDLRQVNMSANPEDAWSNTFPFGVNYKLGNVPAAGRLGPSVETDQALRFALRNAIDSRQGVFEWVRQDSEGLRNKLEQALQTRDAISLGQGFLVYDVSDPRMQDGVVHYDMLVSAPARDKVDEEDTFLVPMTEMRVPEDRVVEADWLHHSETAMQCHLSAVDQPYQDSVENPFILSSGCNELADMHAVQTEVLSRLQAGLILSQQELTRTLHDLTPEFVQGNHSEATRTLLPVLQNQLGAWNSLQRPNEPGLLGAKRYFPTIADSDSDSDSDSESEAGSVVTLESMSESDSESVSGSEAGPVLEMDGVSALESPQESEPEPESASAVSSGPISHAALTLADKAPPHRASEYRAFRQAAVHANHCGIASVNGFFQAEVINTAKAIDHIQAGYARAYGEEQLSNLTLPGLYHPALIDAMTQGQSIVMTRHQFIGEEGFADYRKYSNIYSANPEEQWDAVCNYKFPGEAKPDRVEITPDLWLSAATGVHVDCLTGMVNQFLSTKAENPAWSDYPEKVDKFAVGKDAVRAKLERCINREIENRNGDQAGNTLFPMICMTSGHYSAVARTESGNWVKLDSGGTDVTGVQESSLFADKGKLEQALREEKVIHVICEPSESLKQLVSEVERR